MSSFQIVFSSLYEYFKLSPISTAFFIFLLGTMLLNLIKEIIIWSEKKNVILSESCIYLVIEKSNQSCDLPSRQKDFKVRGDSCEGCKGKTINITKEEMEKRVANDSQWKCIIILSAKYIRNILPYLSFFYTLALAIFENQWERMASYYEKKEK